MNTVITSKEAILTAARILVQEQGMSALNMRAVAKACGIAVGSVYNYFPSKTDLTLAVMQDVWRTIFHVNAQCSVQQSFVGAVEHLFVAAHDSTAGKVSFFTMHPMNLGTDERQKGRILMQDYFAHMQAGLLCTLQADERVKEAVFSDDFTREDFVSFVFSNLITTLTSGADNCRMLVCIIERVLYDAQ